MDPYMSILFMLTISFPEAMLMAYFAIQFMGAKPRLVEIILIGLIQAVIAYIVRNLPIPVGLHTIIQIISCVTLVFVIARLPFMAAAIGIIAGLLVYLVLEISITQLIISISGLTIQNLINDPYLRIVIFAPLAGIMIATIVLFKKFNITFERLTRWQAFKEKYLIDSGLEENILYKEYLAAVVFIYLPILLLFILNFTYVSVQVDAYSGYYSSFFKVLFNVLIIALAFVSLWALRRINRSIEKEYEAKRSAEIIDQLKELILSIRKQRHDFNHHLQTVYGLIETGSYEKAREYIRNTYHYVSGTGELIKTDNPSISALLYTKIVIAETKSIRFDINIECTLEEFPLNSNEASSLLGNLIDNAFDAVDMHESGNRMVTLSIISERGDYFIEVSNKGDIDPSIAKKIFNHSFTTKEGHVGLGLAIVKEMVEKYKGSIKVQSEVGETIFRLRIPFGR